MNILVVEDDPIQLRILVLGLEKLPDCKVKGFINVDDCLFEMAILDEPFILVTDIQLPKRSGVSLIKELDHYPQLQGLVIISALNQQILESIANLAEQVGIEAIKLLAKPFNVNEVKNFVISVIKNLNKSQVSNNKISSPFTLEDLTLSLLDDEYQPYFQPQVDVKTGRVKGVELLGRLYKNHKVYGPDTFIPLLIQSNKITEYTFAILKKGIRLLQSYQFNQATLSINVDYQSLSEADFSKKLIELLTELNFPVTRLVIEVTETSSDLSINVIANLTECRVNDIKISIDDFGMGYSGLNELLNLPFTELKIDKQQINALQTSPKAFNVVKLLCSLTNALNLDSVAEGVETIEQVLILKKMGVKKFQGFLFSKPVPVYELEESIASIEAIYATNKTSLV